MQVRWLLLLLCCRCLTQLGGCAVVGEGGEPLFSWVDQGLCDVPDFELQLLEAL